MKANTHRYGSGHRFGGGTDTVTNEEFTLPSSWRTQRLMHGVHWRGAVTAVAILFILVCHLHAQVTPPPVSLFHTSTGPIAGGVTVGADGVTYFTTLKSGANNARVTALNPDGTVKWTFQPLVGGVSYNLWPLPVLEPDENTLLIGSDAGVFYRLYATSGSEWWSYSVDAPSGTDKKIRSTAAFNANYGSAYFHCNDGFLYAIKAFTGTLRWKKATGNNLGNPPSQGGPPPVDILHPEPWSSSPVIGADHTVYVGSADGKVYAFTSSGGNKWPGPVNLGAPIEATIAIGQDGWLYVGTRASPGGAGLLFAINPAKAAVDPAQAIEWSAAVGSQEPGIIASAVIDQGGFVYCADYNDIIIKFIPRRRLHLTPHLPGLI